MDINEKRRGWRDNERRDERYRGKEEKRDERREMRKRREKMGK